MQINKGFKCQASETKDTNPDIERQTYQKLLLGRYHSYSGGHRFKPLPVYWLSSKLSSVPPGKYKDSILNFTMTVSFRIPSNSFH